MFSMFHAWLLHPPDFVLWRVVFFLKQRPSLLLTVLHSAETHTGKFSSSISSCNVISGCSLIRCVICSSCSVDSAGFLPLGFGRASWLPVSLYSAHSFVIVLLFTSFSAAILSSLSPLNFASIMRLHKSFDNGFGIL